jgi:chromosome segregation ATPase
MSLIRRGDATSLEDEREALRRQRLEGAAEVARLKQELAERVQHVRMRELELEDALARAGRRPPTSTTASAPDSRDVWGLEARAADLAQRETALQARERELDAREEALAAADAPLSKSERELALDEREAELDRRAAELDAATVDERLAIVAARLEELKTAETAFVKTQAELAARSDDLAQHELELAARERELSRHNGGAPAAAGAAELDVEALEARIRRLEQTGSVRGQSFSAGLRRLQQHGTRGHPDAPLH